MAFPKFFVGVWAQPIQSLAKWKAEGVNLIIHPEIPSNTPPDQRQKLITEIRKACADLGLFYIDMPESVADSMAMIADPWCYGLAYPDEPKAPQPNTDPGGFKKAVDEWNAKWDPLLSPAKGKKAIWVNFAGPNVTAGRPWNVGAGTIPLAKQADEICNDWYPIATNTARYWTDWNSGQNMPVSLTNPKEKEAMALGTTLPQYAIRCLKLFFPGKPQWAYVETCQFNRIANVTGRQITADDFKAETDSMLKEGLRGMVYFTHNFKGPGWIPGGGPGQTNWDGRQPDVVQACKEFAAKMTGDVVIPPVTETKLEPRLKAVEDRLAQIVAAVKIFGSI